MNEGGKPRLGCGPSDARVPLTQLLRVPVVRTARGEILVSLHEHVDVEHSQLIITHSFHQYHNLDVHVLPTRASNIRTMMACDGLK